MCAVLREARPLAKDYDLLITADNYGAFAKPGMQYLHFPVSLTPTPARLRPIVNLYFAFGDWLVGVPWSRARHNVTLANSRWTAAGLEQLQGVSARHVLYPPVIDPGDGLPWEQRSNTFLCIGRFHEVKRIEVAMSIVRRLRAHAMPDARLAIVGSPEDPGYHTRLYRFTARDRDWIDIREDLTRADLNALIGRCRYGLQAMEGEHFGMATAELARGGCLVFPHDSGGSPEVVDGEAALLWRTEDDAVARISAIARDAPLGAAVRWRLRRHARGFDSERFAEQFRTIVSEWAPT
jgi:glycosyltransferase involved in cell wall biosynthesis